MEMSISLGGKGRPRSLKIASITRSEFAGLQITLSVMTVRHARNQLMPPNL